MGFKAYQQYQKAKPRKEVQVEAAQGDAQTSIGYGQHDAKVIYGNRKRFSRRKRRIQRKKRALVNKSLNWRQKKLVRRISKRAAKAKTFKTNTHQWQCLKSLDTGGLDGKQGIACFAENTGFTGMVYSKDKACHFSDLFRTAFLDSDTIGSNMQEAEMFRKTKLHMKNCVTKYNIVCSSGCPNAEVNAHFFVCKKSITYDNINGLENGGIGDINGLVPTNLNTLNNTVFLKKQLLRSGGGYFDQMTFDTPGYDPRDDNALINEYFTYDRTERFNVSANANICIEKERRIGMTFNARTVNKYAFIKNVSWLVVFTVLGVPFASSGEFVDGIKIDPPNGGNFGICVRQYHKINWKPVVDSPDMLKEPQIRALAETSWGGVKGPSLQSEATRLTCTEA